MPQIAALDVRLSDDPSAGELLSRANLAGRLREFSASDGHTVGLNAAMAEAEVVERFPATVQAETVGRCTVGGRSTRCQEGFRVMFF